MISLICKIFMAITIVTLLSQSSWPQGAISVRENEVLTLEGEASVSLMEEGPLRTMVFSSDSCPNCIGLKPSWDELKRLYPLIHFLDMSLNNSDTIAKIFGVKKLPTLLVFDTDNELVYSISINKEISTQQDIEEKKEFKPDQEIIQALKPYFDKLLNDAIQKYHGTPPSEQDGKIKANFKIFQKLAKQQKIQKNE